MITYRFSILVQTKSRWCEIPRVGSPKSPNARSRETYPYEGPRWTEESRRGTERRNTHAEDTHGPARFPPTSFQATSNTDAPGGKEWHDAMPLPRKKTKRKMTTTSCVARGKTGWEETDLTPREKERGGGGRERECSNYNRIRVRESHGVIITNT